MSLYNFLKDAENKADAFWFALNAATRKVRQLQSVMLELSPICNFSCPFCYIRKTEKQLNAEGRKILRFDYWKGIIDQLSKMGEMFISFTGGECMMHPDFDKIYRYAISRGMIISMITNGSCLSEKLLETFIEFPPKTINITVYGGSEETYEKICGKKEYYHVVYNNITKLVNAGIPVHLQTTVSKENEQDIEKIYHFSKKMGVTYAFSDTLIQFKDCTKEKIDKNSVDSEKFRNNVKNSIDDFYRSDSEKTSLVPVPQIDTLGVRCSAGRNVAFINHRGQMNPCATFDGFSVSTFEYSIEECWKMIHQWCDNVPQIKECNGCIHWSRCKHCFAMHYNDTQDYTIPSPRLCFKQLYPEQAKEIETYYAEHGKLPPVYK